MRQPVVSVIVPCYNQAHYLDQTLNSILNQTFQDWECIIVNDGSPDNTEENALSWIARDKRFKYFYQKNAGLSAARNSGINLAQGEFILPLDSDDYFEHTYIEKAVGVLIKNNSIGAVTCWTYCFENSGKIIFNYKPKGGNVLDFLYSNNACANSLFRKTTWDLVGGYDEEMKHGYEDWEFWISLTKHGYVIFVIEEFLFYYRQNPNSMLQNTNKFFEEENYRYVLNKHKDLYLKEFDKTIQFLQSRTKKFKTNEIKRLNSMDYRLGKFLLNPIRLIKKMFLKKTINNK